jgi:hypothetical protein
MGKSEFVGREEIVGDDVFVGREEIIGSTFVGDADGVDGDGFVGDEFVGGTLRLSHALATDLPHKAAELVRAAEAGDESARSKIAMLGKLAAGGDKSARVVLAAIAVATIGAPGTPLFLRVTRRF